MDTGIQEQVKRLPEGCKSFEAGGVTYIVHETLSGEAYTMDEELRLEQETGNSAGDVVKGLGKVINHLKTNNVYDASVSAYNALNASERIDSGRPPAWALRLSLFVRPKGSDVSAWQLADATVWIEAWFKEYSAADLFTLANSCQMAFATDFSRSFLNTLNSEDGNQEKAEAA